MLTRRWRAELLSIHTAILHFPSRGAGKSLQQFLRWAGLEAGCPAGSHFKKSSLVSDVTLVSGAREETSEASVDICSRPYTCEVRFRRGVSEDCSLWAAAQRESLLERTGICAGMFQTTRTENSNNSEGKCVLRAVE